MQSCELKCIGCARVVLRNVHNKCMYCGEFYLEKFHLSNEEMKAELIRVSIEKKERKERENKKRRKELMKEKEKRVLSYPRNVGGGKV